MNERQIARVVSGKPEPDEGPEIEPRVEFDPSDNSMRLSGGVRMAIIGWTLPALLWLMLYLMYHAGNSLGERYAGWIILIFPILMVAASAIIVAMWLAFIPWLFARNLIGWLIGLAWFLFAMYMLFEYVRGTELFLSESASRGKYVDRTDYVIGRLTGWFVFLAVAAQVYTRRQSYKLKQSGGD